MTNDDLLDDELISSIIDLIERGKSTQEMVTLAYTKLRDGHLKMLGEIAGRLEADAEGEQVATGLRELQRLLRLDLNALDKEHSAYLQRQGLPPGTLLN
jgi:hypothetical protein